MLLTRRKQTYPQKPHKTLLSTLKTIYLTTLHLTTVIACLIVFAYSTGLLTGAIYPIKWDIPQTETELADINSLIDAGIRDIEGGY